MDPSRTNLTVRHRIFLFFCHFVFIFCQEWCRCHGLGRRCPSLHRRGPTSDQLPWHGWSIRRVYTHPMELLQNLGPLRCFNIILSRYVKQIENFGDGEIVQPSPLIIGGLKSISITMFHHQPFQCMFSIVTLTESPRWSAAVGSWLGQRRHLLLWATVHTLSWLSRWPR